MEGMEKQLTAVNWLVSQLKGVYESDYLNKLIEQAKEMEKEQIMETYYQALCDRFKHNLIPTEYTRKEEVERFGIPYYNETFKSE